MNRRSFLLLATLVGCWKPQPGPVPVDIAAAPVRLVAQTNAGPVTYLEVAVRAGSAHDPVGKEGLAALTAEMLREGGAADRTPEAVDKLLYRLGTDIEVVVGKELVTFRTRALNEDVALLGSLVADMFRAPALDAETFARLKDEAKNELEKGLLQNDEATGLEVLDNLLYAGHPYGHPVVGRAGVIDTLTLDDVRTFLASNYLRSTVTVGIVSKAVAPSDTMWRVVSGDERVGLFSADEAAAADLATMVDALSGLPAGIYDPPTPKRVPAVTGRSLLVVEKSTESTGVHFGHPTDLHRGHPDWPAMLLAFTALGEHRQGHGRLYQRLRGERGLNYGDYAYIERYQQAGWSSRQETGTGRLQNPFYVWLRPVAADDGPFAIRAATAIIEDFVENGLTEEEFTRIRTYLSGRIALWGEDPGRRLGWSVEAVAMGWPEPLTTLPEKVDALELSAVNAAIRAHIHPENLRYVVVTKDAAALQASLSDGVATPMLYSGSTPPAAGTPAAEQDQAWAALPLGITETTIVPAMGIFR